ncbi:MAG: molybdopterin-binding protein [Lachnospiraceae bacterium]|nr:molybdopterin-binding protein [Lachnospiraceae bacterium]
MKLIRTIDAVGHVLCHDMTQIIPGQYKGPVFKKGHVVTQEDIPVLLSIGKQHLYVWEKDEDMLHEDEAARILCRICAGENMHPTGVSEGKIELIADCDGILKIDRDRLRAVNMLGEMMIAARHGDTPVRKGDKLAGTRIIPLVIEKEKMEKAIEAGGSRPLLHLLPYSVRKAAILTTGSEVYKGIIEDRFTPVIEKKLGEFAVEVVFHELFDDDPAALTDGCLRAVRAGAEMVLCTGGMSVDPDDRTPLAIKNTGARIVTYGAPVLPGAMFMLAYYDAEGRTVPIAGLPGCAMYARRTIFDLVLPRLLAGDEIRAEELAALGEGGLCLQCPVCTFPSCGFGKGH